MNFSTTLFFAFLSILPAFADDAPGTCRKQDERFHSEEGGCVSFDARIAFSMRAPGKRIFADAEKYCATLDEGGFNSWRLPKRDELLIAAGKEADRYLSFPTVDFFWTSTGNNTAAMSVTLSGGEVAFEEKEKFTAAVVCARSYADADEDGVPDRSDACTRTPKGALVERVGKRKGCAEKDSIIPSGVGCKEESDFFKTNEGGCQDRKTGLVWSAPSAENKGWRAAPQYCERLVEGWVESKHRDWRLPTAEEIKEVSGAELAVRHFREVPKFAIWASDLTKTNFSSGRPWLVTRRAYVDPRTGAMAWAYTDEWVPAGPPDGSASLVSGGPNTNPQAPVICVRKSK